MKSADRHKLETNWLAIHLDHWIENVRPYKSKIVGVIAAVAVLFLGWTYFSGATSTRQTEAWNAYNEVIGGAMDERSVTQLGKSAEEFSGTDMNPWARVTWADGQVWIASQNILQDRAMATKALTDAASAYQSVIGSSQDEQLVNRATYGLARVYEMRNDVDKAREEYLKVKGSFATLAQRRAEALNNSATRKTLDWLATAEAPRLIAPRGPGMPGQRPALDVDDLKLPGVSGGTGSGDPTKTDFNIDELFKGLGEMGKDASQTGDRYKTDDAAKEGDNAKKGDEKAPTSDEKPATGDAPKTGGDK